MKRRVTTSQVMSNTAVINSNSYTRGIRFIRSSIASSSSQNKNPPTNTNLNTKTESKSFHSELSSIKKYNNNYKV